MSPTANLLDNICLTATALYGASNLSEDIGLILLTISLIQIILKVAICIIKTIQSDDPLSTLLNYLGIAVNELEKTKDTIQNTKDQLEILDESKGGDPENGNNTNKP